MNAAWLTDIHLNFLEHNQVDDFLRTISSQPADCFLMSGGVGEADSIIEYLKVI